MAKRFNIDLESFSPTDLSAAGSYRYWEDPDADVLCVSIRDAETGAVQRWRPGLPPPSFPAGSTMAGWNVEGFDRLGWRAVLAPRYGWQDPDLFEWDDTMLRAAATNLPLGLAKCAAALGTGQEKDTAGHRLMMQLCRPAAETSRSNDPRRLHTPESLARLEAYCDQDTAAEAAIDKILPPLSADLRREQVLDRTINARGLRIDQERVAMMQWVAAAHREDMREQLDRLTQGAVRKETQRASLVQWLNAQGVKVTPGKGATNKDAVTAMLSDPELPDHVEAVLRLVQALGKTSLAKLDAMQASVCRDGRIRGTLQFLAATQTGRWGGRLVQWQNVARGFFEKQSEYEEALDLVRRAYEARSIAFIQMLYGAGPGQPDKVLDLIASLLRACVVPSPGHVFLDADYNAIEPRVVAWLAGCDRTLDAYRAGKDLYVMDAAVALRVPESQIAKKQRNSIGKPCRIGFAYGLGGAKFADYAEGYGATLTEDEGKAIIAAMREAYPAIPAFWKALEKAAKGAINEPGRCFAAGPHIQFGMKNGHLRMRLPNGRQLWYRNARIVQRPAPWDHTRMLDNIEYAYQDQMTHQWTRGTTYGGSLAENATQAVSRDLLVHAMFNCEARGLPVVLHVHDQILAEVPEVGADPVALESAMCDLPSWAAGLPVKAEASVQHFWRK